MKDFFIKRLNYKKPTFYIVIIAVIACVVIAAGLLANPKTGSASIKELAGKQYKFTDEIAKPALASYMVTPETGLEYTVSGDFILYSKTYSTAWQEIGEIKKVKIEEEECLSDSIQDEGLAWIMGYSSEKIYKNTCAAYKAVKIIYTDDGLDTGGADNYYLLFQKNGDILLVESREIGRLPENNVEHEERVENVYRMEEFLTEKK